MSMAVILTTFHTHVNHYMLAEAIQRAQAAYDPWAEQCFTHSLSLTYLLLQLEASVPVIATHLTRPTMFPTS